MVRTLVVFAAVLAALPVAQPSTRRTVSLVVTNGVVVTVDGSRRVIERGAVAIDGRDIAGVDTAAAIASRDHHMPATASGIDTTISGMPTVWQARFTGC